MPSQTYKKQAPYFIGVDPAIKGVVDFSDEDGEGYDADEEAWKVERNLGQKVFGSK